MRVRWSVNAVDDLSAIVEHIRKDNVSAARRVARTIYSGVAALKTFPYSGRPGRAQDTRELVLAPLPYIVVYELIDEQALILRIRHTSQDWP